MVLAFGMVILPQNLSTGNVQVRGCSCILSVAVHVYLSVAVRVYQGDLACRLSNNVHSFLPRLSACVEPVQPRMGGVKLFGLWARKYFACKKILQNYL